MSEKKLTFKLHRLGVDTYNDPIVFLRTDCDVCKAEGLDIPARVRVAYKKKSLIATLNTVSFDLLRHNEAGLSEFAWKALGAREGQYVTISHPRPVESLKNIHKKIFGGTLSKKEIYEIIEDITANRYSNSLLSSLITACSGNKLNNDEITGFTEAMIDTGNRLTWDPKIIVDKHCIGGLPGNRTTPIVLAITTVFGLTMPKTSSRAITSSAGTADTMEVFTHVNLKIPHMEKLVQKENGFFAWSQHANLSPADDILIRVQKTLNLDSPGLLVASVLSKKIAAGSSHLVIDIPIGPTAKIKNKESAQALKETFLTVGKKLNLRIKVFYSDGTQPVGRGIGPALEATDIYNVFKCKKNAPQDLRDRSLTIAGNIIEFSPKVKRGQGLKIATEILDSGKAWKKFKSICILQGGLRKIPTAKYTHPVVAKKEGVIQSIDNFRISNLAKFSGAPEVKSAGVYLNAKVGSSIKKGDTLFTIHTSSTMKLDYVIDYLSQENEVMLIK